MIHNCRTWLLLYFDLLIILHNIIFLLLHASNHIKLLFEILPLLIDALIYYLLVLLDLFNRILFVL